MPKPSGNTETRACRRAIGMRSIETVFYEIEIAELVRLKAVLGVGSRSEVLRVLIAKIRSNTFTPADAAVLLKRVA